MVRVYIDYSDGRHTYARRPSEGPLRVGECDVPASTVALWDAIVDLDRVMGRQLADLDNANFVRDRTKDPAP